MADSRFCCLLPIRYVAGRNLQDLAGPLAPLDAWSPPPLLPPEPSQSSLSSSWSTAHRTLTTMDAMEAFQATLSSTSTMLEV